MREGERLVIVGGGPAGLSTARAYRQAGGRAQVILLAGEGLAPYQRPPLTKELLRGESTVEALWLEAPTFYAEQDIQLRLGAWATELDPGRRELSLAGGERLGYDACVLACGSVPAVLPVEGGDHPDLLTVRELGDSRRLGGWGTPEHDILVVGTGFIGCEAAASLSGLGASVAMVSMEELPQQTRLGAEVAQRLAGWLAGDGVVVHGGEQVAEVQRTATGWRVAFESGRSHDAHAVLLATGVRRRLELAQGAGLEVSDGSVATDSGMATSAEGVLAVGDLAAAENPTAGRRLHVEHWGEALAHGEVAGRRLAGQTATWDSVPGFWSTIGKRTLKYAAWGDGFDVAELEEHSEGAFTVTYGRDGTVVGVLTHRCDEAYEHGREQVAQGSAFSPGSARS